MARRRGALRACGADMAAHCINDVITCGADPLILLDYVAANQLDLEQVAELVEGAAEVCRAAGVALIGGETAELPGVYREGELDFAATCVGIVDRDRRDRRLGRARGRRRRRPALGRRPCERVHARPAACSRSRTTTGRTCSRRRGSTSTTSAGCAGRRTRSRTSRAAASRATSAASSRTASGRELDWDAWERPPVFALARPATSRRRSCGASSTSASATARSCRSPGDDLVIGRIVDGVIGVLVSGEGSNLQALLDAGLPVAAVASNRPGVPGARARRDGPECAAAVFELDEFADREQRDAAMANWLAGAGSRARCLRRLHAPADARRSSTASRSGSSTCTRRCCRSSPARARSTRRSRPGWRRPASPCTSSTRGSTPAP